jgi:hypothetical protein
MIKFEICIGMWNEIVKAVSLDKVLEMTQSELTYTQEDVLVFVNNVLVASRKWYSTLDGIEECEKPIQFGDFGFYDDWQIAE